MLINSLKMDPIDLNERADIAFTNKQFIEAGKLYIEAGKAGHSECIDTLYKIDPEYITCDSELLLSKVVDYLKIEHEKLEQVKDTPVQLYFEKYDAGSIGACYSDYDKDPIGACYSDYDNGPIGAWYGDDNF